MKGKKVIWQLVIILAILTVLPVELLAAGITVITPNGGETWQAGSTRTIRWRTTGNIQKVKIVLKKGGRFYMRLTPRGGIANTGSFRWSIPADIIPDNNYRIKISTLDNSDSDKSNANFTIYALGTPAVAPLILDSPNGGEMILQGATVNITWVSNTARGRVVVSLEKDGRRVTMLSPPGGVPASRGRLRWDVPEDLPAGNYKVVITRPGGEVLDRSDSPFSIVSMPSHVNVTLENSVVSLPDLVPTDIWLVYAPPVPGCAIKTRIRNNGPGQINMSETEFANNVVVFLIGSNYPWAFTLSQLMGREYLNLRQPGGEVVVTAPTDRFMPRIETEFRVQVEVDGNYEITEGNESNNIFYKRCTCDPDLADPVRSDNRVKIIPCR